jgi:AraC-like DNA-binding protein
MSCTPTTRGAAGISSGAGADSSIKASADLRLRVGASCPGEPTGKVMPSFAASIESARWVTLETYADSPLVHDPDLARMLNTTWKAMAAPRAWLAAEELFQHSVIALAARHAGLLLPRVAHISAPAVQRVRDYLHEHVDRAVSVRELASVASMSRFQLTRQFQRAFGLPLHAYHLHARLEEAKRRLRRGAPIIDVANALGFADQSHFHRRFKGWFGVTPKEWQQAHKHPRPAVGSRATLRT